MNDVPKQCDDPIVDWMQNLAAAPPAGSLPDAEVIWWQAQALRRLDQQRRLAALLDLGDYAQLGGGALAALLLLLQAINAIPVLSPAFTLLGAGCVALAGIAVVLTIWDVRRAAD
jgi:hypothetical protein